MGQIPWAREGGIAWLGSGLRNARRRGIDRKFLTILGIAWSCMACRMKGNVAGLASNACFSFRCSYRQPSPPGAEREGREARVSFQPLWILSR